MTTHTFFLIFYLHEAPDRYQVTYFILSSSFAKWASNSISICSDFDSEIDLAGLVDLHQDLHFVSGQVENVLFSKIRDKVSSNESDIETLKLANKEAQNRILEPTKNIQEHVQVYL